MVIFHCYVSSPEGNFQESQTPQTRMFFGIWGGQGTPILTPRLWEVTQSLRPPKYTGAINGQSSNMGPTWDHPRYARFGGFIFGLEAGRCLFFCRSKKTFPRAFYRTFWLELSAAKHLWLSKMWISQHSHPSVPLGQHPTQRVPRALTTRCLASQKQKLKPWIRTSESCILPPDEWFQAWDTTSERAVLSGTSRTSVFHVSWFYEILYVSTCVKSRFLFVVWNRHGRPLASLASHHCKV